MANPHSTPPTSPPDPARNYERADPQNESPAGQLGQAKQTPACCPDRAEEAVPQRQPPSSQLYDDSARTRQKPLTDQSKIKGDMNSEEPLGWDQAPQDIKDPRQKRHPRPDGVGGSEPNRNTDH